MIYGLAVLSACPRFTENIDMPVMRKILCLGVLVLFVFTAAVKIVRADGDVPAASLSIDTRQAAEKPIGNKLSNVNLWMFQTFSLPTESDKNDGCDLTPFVEYVQFMQATGSSPARDLFKDPENLDVLDDYEFAPLLEACAKVLQLGAKPHIKFSVPSKFAPNPQNGDFGTNVFPPDDYEVYGRYAHALCRALVERFGREEVETWRFGVLTEFENPGWFRARSGDPAESREAYFKLYDYTVEALVSEIGPNVCVGAHAMSCSEGLWDERDLLDHCAKGVNYKTGETGTRICYMASSFYDYAPGKPNAVPLPEVIGRLRARAEEVGLGTLYYGIDEGRILYGLHSGASSRDLCQRVVGRTYQAAYDARLLKMMVDADIDYFSSWSYSTGVLYRGIPTPSYYVALLFSRFRNARSVPAAVQQTALPEGVEVNAVAGYEPETKTLRVMLYHFKDDYDYAEKARAQIQTVCPDFAGKRLRMTAWTIDDGVNFFPEWEKDRQRLGIEPSASTWSPDDPGLDTGHTLSDAKVREIYDRELRPRYAEIARRFQPETAEFRTDDGSFQLDAELDRQGVIFYEITPMNDTAR